MGALEQHNANHCNAMLRNSTERYGMDYNVPHNATNPCQNTPRHAMPRLATARHATQRANAT
eukprot:1272871-Lingulodinium_polyedra.AAC.1